MDPIYLDHCATTPIDPSVVAAMSEAFVRVRGNPSSQHRAGREARARLEDAADGILTCLGGNASCTPPDRVVFTSGGTEANNLALLGQPDSPGARLIVSSLEHPSTLGAAEQLRRRGWRIDSIRARECGAIDLDHLAELLDEGDRPPRLVSVMLVNHETGVLQPIAQVVELCRQRGVPVHTDAAQAVGKVPVDFHELGVSLMTVAAHKFHGPTGIGALLVRSGTLLEPILYGGPQQLAMRPGTEPLALVVGMQAALELVLQRGPDGAAHLQRCRDELQRRLLESSGSKVQPQVNGSSPRAPHVLNISFPGVDRQALLMALDLAGVFCSSGSACASGSSEPSHVLRAMGLPAARTGSAIRLSVGLGSRTDEMTSAAERILRAANQLRA